MDQKQEAEIGLHLPWLVLLDIQAAALGYGTVPAPALRSSSVDNSSSLKRTEEECREGGCENSCCTENSRFEIIFLQVLQDPSDLPPSYILQCQRTMGGVVQERRVTWGPRCKQALIVGCPTYIYKQPPDMRNCDCFNSFVPHFTVFSFTV